MMLKPQALALFVALLLFSLKARAQLRDSTALTPDSILLQQRGNTALTPDSISLQSDNSVLQHSYTHLRRDSVDWSAGGAFRRRIDRHTSTKAYRMLFIGTPLIVGGVIMQSYDRDFQRLRNGHVPSFHQKYDDWLQYAPAGAMLAMKACGVKSRSSWGRMLVSDAFSAGLMAIAVNSLKYTCRVMRPDGSTRNSFPSGHTATAFMTATMLHKEYGHLSPWYSIGGYAVATATGVTRQLNNRHWMSDVMVGAGIGILAAEFGYFLADLIFKERGLNVYETFSGHDRYRHPSFVGFAIGVTTIPGNYTPREGMRMRFHAGPTTGVQGAWFASPYWGIGGRLACSNLLTEINSVIQDDNFKSASVYVGPYFSYPVSLRWQVGSKLLGGYEFYKRFETSFGDIPGRNGAAFATGVSTTYLATQNLGVRFAVDYDLAPSLFRGSGEPLHKLSFGIEVCAVFWPSGRGKATARSMERANGERK